MRLRLDMLRCRVIRRVATRTGASYMAHSIITVATMKGGSGKSTLASCLAAHWHLNGRRTAIIDADPQRTIARLAAREKALGGLTVIEDASEIGRASCRERVKIWEGAETDKEKRT